MAIVLLNDLICICVFPRVFVRVLAVLLSSIQKGVSYSWCLPWGVLAVLLSSMQEGVSYSWRLPRGFLRCYWVRRKQQKKGDFLFVVFQLESVSGVGFSSGCSFASGQICHIDLGVVGSLQNGVSRYDGDDLRVTRSVY